MCWTALGLTGRVGSGGSSASGGGALRSRRRRREAHPRGGRVDVVHFMGVGGQVVQLIAVCRQEGQEQGSVSGGAGWRPVELG